MTIQPIPILNTTTAGNRRHVRWLNQPTYSGKVEPNRRKAGLEPRPPRKGEPGRKTLSSTRVVTDASLLLVILHYLLKNNTAFMGCCGAGQVVPRLLSAATFYGGQLR